MSSETIRVYAADVGLMPPINGANNVQDALGAAGSDITLLSPSANSVQQTTPTAITGDGAQHDITCTIASPPAWMNNTGNITAPGIYQTTTTITATAGPTTPVQYMDVATPFGQVTWVPCDALGASGDASPTDVIALVTADLPALVQASVTMPTDATEHVTVQIGVIRLASAGA